MSDTSWQRNYVVLPTGDRVRFTLLQRPGSSTYFVRFQSMDRRRLEKSTGQTRKPDAIDQAHVLIREDYQVSIPSSETVTWAVAKERVERAMLADGNRDVTIKGYFESLDKLIRLYPLAKGPADISPGIAADFKRKYSEGTFTRKRKVKAGESAPTYTRSAKSVRTRLIALKAVWEWFKRERLAADNPFAEVSLPKVDRQVKYVTKDDVSGFFDWLRQRYPDWGMPVLFFRVKALTACRLNDLCGLASADVRDGGIHFPAPLVKNRRGRFAHLPKDLYDELRRYGGGRDHLWEKYPAELLAANKKLGVPTHRMNPEFSTRRLYLWVVQLMQIFQDQTGKNFSSHDFRRAAFTRAAEKNIHPKRVSAGFGVTAETLLSYYTAVEQRAASEEIGADLEGDLDPTK